jgi:AraC-like DNA-binding protein
VNGIVIANLVGAAEGFFAAFIVFAQAPKRRANLWLGCFVLACALLCAGEAASRSDLPLSHPDAILWADGLMLALGPLLYIYLRAFTGETVAWQVALLHLLPALLTSGLLWSWHFLPYALKAQSVQMDRQHPPSVDGVLVVMALQILIYLGASLRHLAQRSEELKEVSGNLSRISFLWLRRLILVNLAIYVFWLPSVAPGMRWGPWLAALAFPLGNYALAACALASPEIYAPAGMEGSAAPLASLEALEPLENPDRLGAEGPSTEKYRKSRLPDPLLRRYEQRLLAVMEARKSFLDPELTLSALAEQAGISAHHLSQVLNERLGTRFCEYINGLRVAEAQRLLSDPTLAHLTVLDLAHRAGFSSKATFNSVFKRNTGRTPAAWRADTHAEKDS